MDRRSTTAFESFEANVCVGTFPALPSYCLFLMPSVLPLLTYILHLVSASFGIVSYPYISLTF